MPVAFNCKCCGAGLEFEQGATVAKCEYCGVIQTLPRLDDDRRKGLYARANYFRQNGDFDKAMVIYEQILNEDNTDSEAYWSLVLCRYGVEYVEDPSTHRRVPTVNRTQPTAVTSDKDYQMALNYADAEQAKIYKAEAEAIDKIQSGILEISRREKPFDVFISYKDSDNNGQRTPDSVIAVDLYERLTQEGFKVFCSRITLEDKIGQKYEPYIFAALNSAPVMIALGTKPEYFNAVWVRNEWSRYLGLIKNGAKKTLIPAFKDMSPYDLPEEFAHLQAQDMSKIGFMQDLVRGVKKLIRPETKKTETVIVGGDNSDALVRRAFLALEDGEFDNADKFLEQALNQNPENASAYLGKLMVEKRVRQREDLAKCSQPFDDSKNYKNALRFGDENLVSELEGYIADIKDRIENERLTGIYNQAVASMRAERYQEALNIFKNIAGFKDSNELIKTCEEIRIENERKAEQRRIEAERQAARNKKMMLFGSVAAVIVVAVAVLYYSFILPASNYNNAVALKDSGRYSEAITVFQKLGDYKDSKAQIEDLKPLLLRNATVGDHVFFGKYEQDNNTSNGKEDIEWIVLAKENNRALLISRYALDCKKYNETQTSITWENCTLRHWLNETFLNEAFNASEQAKILTVRVNADKNPSYNTNPGNPAQDKIFLLSIPEARNYFASDLARQCRPTAYAKSQRVYVNNDGYAWWWLRSPGNYDDLTASIGGDGSVSLDGDYVDNGNIGIRPALWLNL